MINEQGLTYITFACGMVFVIDDDEWKTNTHPESKCINAMEVVMRLRDLLMEIEDLALGLPGGIDEEADPMNQSPKDATAHVGGLIWQACQREKA